MSAETLNPLSEEDAARALTRCCGSSRWVRGMLARRPFADDEALHAAADEVWATMERADILEAFTHHPRIGGDLDALREKFGGDVKWSGDEQASIHDASEAVLTKLRDGNVAYEARYGFIFIVCATGKSAAEMLALLQGRMNHEPGDELAIAAAEQAKITHLRLEKLDE
ncbi:MAG: 2-oxo-4-hydroxy-4-carboxy-5-ureidoimidazoline decarboxylase [Myxococcota bacterium]